MDLLIVDALLCGWTHRGTHHSDPDRRKDYQPSSHTLNSDGDSSAVEINHSSRKKRKRRSIESVENSSTLRPSVKQNLPLSGYFWKACIDEETVCYRPDNREYLQWKTSARSQLQDRIEKRSCRTVRDDCASAESTASKPEAERQPTPVQVAEEDARKADTLPASHFLDFGSSNRSSRDDKRSRKARWLVMAQRKADILKGHGLPEERFRLPAIFSQTRFSHQSPSTEQRRLELRTLSVEGVQVPDPQRRCGSGGEEEDDGKHTEDWLLEEEEEEGVEEDVEEEVEDEVKIEVEEEGEEAEEKRARESKVDDVGEFESNVSSVQNSRVDFGKNAGERRMECGNELSSHGEEEGSSTKLDSEWNKSPSTAEGQEEDDTSSSLSMKADERRQTLRRISPDHQRFRRSDADLDDDQKGETLTGVLTISGINPPIESEGSSGSETTSGSEFKSASHLEWNRSEGSCEGSEGVAQKLCLDFRRNPDEDHHPNQSGYLPRLRGSVRAAKPHRSRTSSSDPSRNLDEVTRVVGVTFGDHIGHVMQARRDVKADVTSQCRPEDGIDTSSSSALKDCSVINNNFSQSSCRIYSNGFHPQPIGIHHKRTRRTVAANHGDVALISPCADLEGKLPLISGTRVQNL